MPSDWKTIDISTGTILRIVAIGLGLYLLFTVWQIIASLFLAVVIATALEAPIRWLTKFRIPRFLSVFIIYLLGFALIAGTFYALFPLLLDDVRQLAAEFPGQYGAAQENLRQFFGGLPGQDIVSREAQMFFEDLQGELGNIAGSLFAFLVTIFGGALSFVLVLVISFYLALQERGVERFLTSIFPRDHHEYVVDFWKRIQRKITRWIQAELILVLFIAATLFPGLWILGVDYVAMLAISAALLEIIPVIGPLVAGVLIFSFALFQSVPLALLALGYFVLLQLVQQYVVVPTVMRRAVGLSPIVIIIALLVGAKLAGVWGVLLAIPVTATISELFGDIARRNNGD